MDCCQQVEASSKKRRQENVFSLIKMVGEKNFQWAENDKHFVSAILRSPNSSEEIFYVIGGEISCKSCIWPGKSKKLLSTVEVSTSFTMFFIFFISFFRYSNLGMNFGLTVQASLTRFAVEMLLWPTIQFMSQVEENLKSKRLWTQQIFIFSNLATPSGISWSKWKYRGPFILVSYLVIWWVSDLIIQKFHQELNNLMKSWYFINILPSWKQKQLSLGGMILFCSVGQEKNEVHKDRLL